MVLSGQVNKAIVNNINRNGGTSIGLSGKDGSLIEARKLRKRTKVAHSNVEQIIDLGFVGEPNIINPDILLTLEESNIIPVVASIGVGSYGETYNINADSVAGALAVALSATKLILLTDVDGILNAEGVLINKTSVIEMKNLIRNNVIRGGMIPKVETAINTIENNGGTVHILNGTIPHVLLMEIFTEHGVGTMINF